MQDNTAATAIECCTPGCYRRGNRINVKRTYWLYTLEGLTVRKRRRKKLPGAEREPLTRPEQPNEVWSMDFVFDEVACGRKMKILTVVDDCSNEAVLWRSP